MELPRQPLPTKITITGDNAEDIYRTFLVIKRVLDNHYASTEHRTTGETHTIDCYPFAVND